MRELINMNVEKYVMRKVRRQGYRNYRRNSTAKSKRNTKVALAKKRAVVTRNGYSNSDNTVGIVILIFIVVMAIFFISLI
jgi:hypothetical protein